MARLVLDPQGISLQQVCLVSGLLVVAHQGGEVRFYRFSLHPKTYVGTTFTRTSFETEVRLSCSPLACHEPLILQLLGWSHRCCMYKTSTNLKFLFDDNLAKSYLNLRSTGKKPVFSYTSFLRIIPLLHCLAACLICINTASCQLTTCQKLTTTGLHASRAVDGVASRSLQRSRCRKAQHCAFDGPHRSSSCRNKTCRVH